MKIGVLGHKIAALSLKKITMIQKIASTKLSAQEAEVTSKTATIIKIKAQIKNQVCCLMLINAQKSKIS